MTSLAPSSCKIFTTKLVVHVYNNYVMYFIPWIPYEQINKVITPSTKKKKNDVLTFSPRNKYKMKMSERLIEQRWTNPPTTPTLWTYFAVWEDEMWNAKYFLKLKTKTAHSTLLHNWFQIHPLGSSHTFMWYCEVTRINAIVVLLTNVRLLSQAVTFFAGK